MPVRVSAKPANILNLIISVGTVGVNTTPSSLLDIIKINPQRLDITGDSSF